MVFVKCCACGCGDTKLLSYRDYPKLAGSPFEKRRCRVCGAEHWYNKKCQPVDEQDTLPKSLWKERGLA